MSTLKACFTASLRCCRLCANRSVGTSSTCRLLEGIKYFRGRQFTVLPSMQCEQFPKGCGWSQTVKFVLLSFHPVRLRLKGCGGRQTLEFVLPTIHPVRAWS